MNNELNEKKSLFTSEHLCLVAILLLAILLRLIRLGTFPFWADEAYSMVASSDVLGFFSHNRFKANHPPLSYVLLTLWKMCGMGVNEYTVRALPALFGVFGVGALYWLGKQLFNYRVGLVAALLLAISPFHVLHSQDLKEYIYLPFFATLAIGFLYRGVVYGKKRDWYLYGILAGICCYTEAFAIPLLFTVNCWFLCIALSHTKQIKNWIISNLLGAFIFLPWLGIMLSKVHTYMVKAEGWWIPWPSPLSIAFYFKTIAFGYSAIKPYFYIAFLLFFILFLYGIYSAWRQSYRPALLVTMWAVMPVAIVYMLSFWGQSIFLIRSMLPYAIPVYIFVALAIVSLKPNILRNSILRCDCDFFIYRVVGVLSENFPFTGISASPRNSPP